MGGRGDEACWLAGAREVCVKECMTCNGAQVTRLWGALPDTPSDSGIAVHCSSYVGAALSFADV